MVEQWGQQYCLTTVELPGHGSCIGSPYSLTNPEDLVKHWLAIAPPQAIWIGWSLGGLLVQMAAATAPQQIKKAVSLCMGSRFVHDPQWPFGVTDFALQEMQLALLENPAKCLRDFNQRQVAGTAHKQSTLLALDDMIKTPYQLEELVAGLSCLSTLDMRTQMAQTAVPLLFITGACDKVNHKKTVQSSAELVPHGRYLEIKGAGHAPLLSHPIEVAAGVQDFLSIT